MTTKIQMTLVYVFLAVFISQPSISTIVLANENLEEETIVIQSVVEKLEVTRPLFLFDEIGGNRIGVVSPQTVTIIERHCERWVKIYSWMGHKWLYIGPQLPRVIDPSQPMIALTFDDGPAAHTLSIANTFEMHGANATFFVLGRLAEQNPYAIIELSARGFEVLGHSWDHPDLTRLSQQRVEEQILRTQHKIESLIGSIPMMYRTPYGAQNDTVFAASKNTGFSIIHWSRDPMDWHVRNANTVANLILYGGTVRRGNTVHRMGRARDGDIIVLHDTHQTTAVAMERVVPALIARGYQLVTVSELFYHRGIDPQPGVMYHSARA